eukprot:Phypoly_transcript_04138.p1 GENE.Phypoly_transcript_04138~~Phypoly_transcript_04138.p1  ORF type:complete len:735 (+),score=172.87 Phypoly_transcript_04138:151-2205(+)
MTSTVAIQIGRSDASFPIAYNPPRNPLSVYAIPVSAQNLVLNNPYKVSVVDPYNGTFTLSAVVKNNSPSPVYNTSVSVVLQASDDLAPTDPRIGQRIEEVEVPYIGALSELAVTIVMTHWNGAGTFNFLVTVNPDYTLPETSIDDNSVTIQVDVWYQIKLQVNPSTIVLTNTTESTILSFALASHKLMVPEVNISVYSHDIFSPNYVLIGTIPFVNVSSSNCQIGSITVPQDLAANFTELTDFLVIVPPYFSGSAASAPVVISMLDALYSNALPDCAITQFTQPALLPISSQTVHLGKVLDVPLATALFDKNFRIEFGFASAAPAFATLEKGNNTATVEFAPTNFDIPQVVSNSSWTPSGSTLFTVQIGLVDEGIFYSTQAFNLTVLSPVVLGMSPISALGGLVTITGLNFGDDESEITVKGGANEQFTCTQVQIVAPETAISCVMSPGAGFNHSLWVYVGSARSINNNTLLSFEHGFALDPRLNSDNFTVYAGVPTNLTITITDHPDKIHLILDCVEEGCTIEPCSLFFHPNVTSLNFTLTINPPDANRNYTLRYIVSGENGLSALQPEPSHIYVLDHPPVNTCALSASLVPQNNPWVDKGHSYQQFDVAFTNTGIRTLTSATVRLYGRTVYSEWNLNPIGGDIYSLDFWAGLLPGASVSTSYGFIAVGQDPMYISVESAECA